MAHLLKLEDYVSRYQNDIYRYPSQYTRLKKERWKQIKEEWEKAHQLPVMEKEIVGDQVDWLETKEGLLQRIQQKVKGLFKKDSEDNERSGSEEMYRFKYKSMEEVKTIFLEELFEFQLKWASSSLVEISHIDPKYYVDEQLKFFLQQIPDNYFLLYNPVIKIKNAPVELDIVLLAPTEIWCLTVLDGHEYSVFQSSSDRYWLELIEETQKKRLSPIIAINRMVSIIQPLMREAEIEMPIKKAVIAPNSLIDVTVPGHQVQFIDRRDFTKWTEKLIKNPSPIKHNQLKTAQLLLSQCQTTGLRRKEFSNENSSR